MSGSKTGSLIITEVGRILHDQTNVRWPETELLDYINAAQREIVYHKPSANVSSTSESLSAAGNTITLSANTTIAVLDCHTATRGLILLDREILDKETPGWRNESGVSGAPYHYMYDRRIPNVIEFYPAPEGTATITIYRAVNPTELTGAGETINLNDEYANSIVLYVLARAMAKNAEYAGNQQVAQNYMNLFMQSLGVYRASETVNDPNVNSIHAFPPGGSNTMGTGGGEGEG